MNHASWLSLFAVFGGCISSAPPAPPVRWFDPLVGLAFTSHSDRSVHVTADAHLGQEILVRVAPKELAFDAGHRWVMPVEHLLQRAFGAAVATPAVPAGAARSGDVRPRAVDVRVTAFELRRGAEPGAHIDAIVTPAGARSLRVTVTVQADDELPDLVDAMTTALGKFVEQVLDLTDPG